MTTVWVTKYALSDGIVETELRADGDYGKDPNWVWVVWPGAMGDTLMLRKIDVYHSRASAAERAEEMRISKIASLRKQIAKLEKKVFT